MFSDNENMKNRAVPKLYDAVIYYINYGLFLASRETLVVKLFGLPENIRTILAINGCILKSGFEYISPKNQKANRISVSANGEIVALRFGCHEKYDFQKTGGFKIYITQSGKGEYELNIW